MHFSQIMNSIFQQVPNLPVELRSMNFFIWATDFKLFLGSFIFITAFQLTEFVPLILITDWNVRSSIKKSTQSRQTMQLQLKFLMALYAQVSQKKNSHQSWNNKFRAGHFSWLVLLHTYICCILVSQTTTIPLPTILFSFLWQHVDRSAR